MIVILGFLQGIDYPYIDTIIFYKMLYGLLNIVQDSERGSCSGQPSVIVSVTDSKTLYKQHKQQSVNYILEKKLYKLVTLNIYQ